MICLKIVILKILVFEVSSKKIILISIKKILKFRYRKSCAELFKLLSNGKNNEYVLNTDTVVGKYENFRLSHSWFKLKSYEFKKYKTKKNLK